jgi:hypothetical protein
MILKLLGAQDEYFRAGIVITGEPTPRYHETLCWYCHERKPRWAKKYGHEEVKVCDVCKEKWG